MASPDKVSTLVCGVVSLIGSLVAVLDQKLQTFVEEHHFQVENEEFRKHSHQCHALRVTEVIVNALYASRPIRERATTAVTNSGEPIKMKSQE